MRSLFLQNTPSKIFDMVLNKPLVADENESVTFNKNKIIFKQIFDIVFDFSKIILVHLKIAVTSEAVTQRLSEK